MIDRTHTIEVDQAITAEQKYRACELGWGNRFHGGRHKPDSTFYTFGPLGDDRAADVWAYVCEEGLRATLVTETRVSNYVTEEVGT